MPSLKDIRTRIGSVKNTQQITRAMKLVAAAKLKRATETALAARPYAEALDEVGAPATFEVYPFLPNHYQPVATPDEAPAPAQEERRRGEF